MRSKLKLVFKVNGTVVPFCRKTTCLGLKLHGNHPDCFLVLILVSWTMYKTPKPAIGVAGNYLEGSYVVVYDFVFLAMFYFSSLQFFERCRVMVPDT